MSECQTNITNRNKAAGSTGSAAFHAIAHGLSAMYEQSLSPTEANEAARNLTGFFETLAEIERMDKEKGNAGNGSADRAD
jgi:hypothetical protein